MTERASPTSPWRRVPKGPWRLCCGHFLLLCVVLSPLPHEAYSQVTHLEKSLRLVGQGQLEQAEKEARMGLADPSTQAVAWAIIGGIRLQQKRYDESSIFLKRAIHLNPDLVGAHINLGNVYEIQGKTALAREAFKNAIKIDPANFNARFDLAQLNASLGDFRGSLEVSAPIHSELSKSAEGLLLLATDYSGLQQKEAARALLPSWKSLAVIPREASFNFGTLLMKNGLREEAIEVFEKAKRDGQASYEIAFSLATGYLSKIDLQQAEDNHELALIFKPDCTPCLLGIAHIAEEQHNTEKALAYLLRARRLDAENPQILFEFGKVCLERDLVDDGLAALEKAVKLRPDNDSYRFALASAHVAKKQYGDARSLLGGLLDEHPNDSVLNYSLGAVLYLESHFSEAEGYIKKSIQLQPEQVAAYYYLGLILERQGEDDLALGVFRDVVKRHPDHAPTYEALGTLLLKKKNYPEAQQSLEKAILLDPNLVEAHYQLGRLLGRMGKVEESNQQIEISRKIESEQRAKNELRLHILNPQ